MFRERLPLIVLQLNRRPTVTRHRQLVAAIVKKGYITPAVLAATWGQSGCISQSKGLWGWLTQAKVAAQCAA